MTTSGRWADALQRAWLVRGPLAIALRPLAALFGAVLMLRRALYRFGVLRVERLPVPVVVVGNLIVGGAGKTPTVLAVVDLLRGVGRTPGVISRGYGRAAPDALVEVEPATPAAACGDEPLVLRRRAGVPVVVGRDRVAAARELLARHPGVDVIVSDDGLQHWRLGRDAQVLVFDERGVGNGWLLPAGPLREPLPAHLPARSCVLYNAPAPTTRWPGPTAERRLAGVVGLADWWRGDRPDPHALGALSGRRVLAAAGIARPRRFFDLLAAAGVEVVPLALPDHFDFATLPWPNGTADVVVTEKDAAKLDPHRIGVTRVWVAALDFAPGAAFEAALLALLPAARHGTTDGTTPS
ncbi:tetraacyldisaccharide 4'-kinase [Piscinibacter koreensis]|uniref:Tetraacyldisaccharide 4'-kinase n=1 Tax=Piscinibacter koreensis TaxID=2742824 RepID=A0A7Y6TVF2_9BURK|nr:tetraacyldisaccharide 4'-kinase [Schlegelella koreensis]NUZ04938.1 tetraacyldisaccharide 4'-kinase [Schlegelella koreensis]